MVSKKKYWKVGGNKSAGFHLIIPREAYLIADQPKAYTCAVMQDGTLVYQPVRS